MPLIERNKICQTFVKAINHKNGLHYAYYIGGKLVMNPIRYKELHQIIDLPDEFENNNQYKRLSKTYATIGDHYFIYNGIMFLPNIMDIKERNVWNFGVLPPIEIGSKMF